MFETVLRDRMTVIEPLIKGGAVLDLGCVDARTQIVDSAERIEHKPNLLHKRIFTINPNVVGVDIDPTGVTALNSAGYHVICGDVENDDFGGPYDAIIAGELIEHLENPGRWLRNMRRQLKPGGTIVISTPNPFYTGQSWKIWRYGRPMVHEDHMNWQDPTTLVALLKRTGFAATAGYWIQPPRSPFKTWKQHLRHYFSHGFMILAK